MNNLTARSRYADSLGNYYISQPSIALSNDNFSADYRISNTGWIILSDQSEVE